MHHQRKPKCNCFMERRSWKGNRIQGSKSAEFFWNGAVFEKVCEAEFSKIFDLFANFLVFFLKIREKITKKRSLLAPAPLAVV